VAAGGAGPGCSVVTLLFSVLKDVYCASPTRGPGGGGAVSTFRGPVKTLSGHRVSPVRICGDLALPLSISL